MTAVAALRPPESLAGHFLVGDCAIVGETWRRHFRGDALSRADRDLSLPSMVIVRFDSNIV